MNAIESGLFLAGVLLSAVALDLAVARPRIKSRDSGVLWATQARIWASLTVVLMSVTVARDFTDGVAQWLPASASTWAIVLTTVWLVLFFVALLGRPAGERMWLSGGIGFANGRRWILGFVAVLVIPLTYSFGTRETHDSALWTATALMAVTLCMTAWSEGKQGGTAVSIAVRSQIAVATNSGRADWPHAMRSAGIHLDALPLIAPVLADGNPIVPPEMTAVIERLMAAPSTAPEDKRTAMIFAPPFHGQEEALVSVLTELGERGDEVVLIISPSDPTLLCNRLKRCVGNAAAIAAVDRKSETWTAAGVWVAAANILSDYLLSRLRDDAAQVNRETLPLLNRIGLIVWWDVHEYSGVRAANLWAISRRLNRLLLANGRVGFRTLLFSVSPGDASDRTLAFLSHLFPYRVAKELQVFLRPRPTRVISAFVAQAPATQTVEASVRSGWVTRAIPTDAESAARLEDTVDRKIQEALALSLPEADATVLWLAPQAIASLPDTLATCGRTKHGELPHYVALVLPKNPYVDFLMTQFREQQRVPSTRLLVGAEGHPALIGRHAQLALREYPDTRAGLRAVFRWDDEVLSATLLKLAKSNQLHREAVRFIDSDRRLRRDHLYANQQPGDSRNNSLDTVGVELTEVREAASKAEDPQLRVDPKREGIDAYPRRVFFSGGRRYRVSESGERPLLCKTEDVDVVTWRGRTSRFHRLRGKTQTMVSRGVHRYSVSGDYREELTEVIELLPSGVQRISLTTPVKTEFSTRALVLDAGRETDPDALHLAALVLRCIVPVHVGVDETHLEIVPLISERLPTGGFVNGLAFVDLMPGGIGVTEAFEEDESLLHFLIDQAYYWLAGYRGMVKVQDLFKDVPVAMATGGVAGLRLESAVELFAHMSGRPVRK